MEQVLFNFGYGHDGRPKFVYQSQSLQILQFYPENKNNNPIGMFCKLEAYAFYYMQMWMCIYFAKKRESMCYEYKNVPQIYVVIRVYN